MRKTNTINVFYKQSLPHILPIGATFFVTFRLNNSLPQVYMRKISDELEANIFEIRTSYFLNPEAEIYKQQKIFFKKFDAALDEVYDGIDYLKNDEVAQIIADRMHKYDGKYYNLLAYCIMPNHVHLVIDTSVQVQGLKKDEINAENYKQLDVIMQLIKGGSSFEINKVLNQTGKFWQLESYDHYARSVEELSRIIWYVVNNPVKAKLVKEWTDFPFTYCGWSL